MERTLFEALLHEDEGVTLDFKRDQYKFDRASDNERSELAKDIVGFANAWRRSDAYILIGVEHVRGGRSAIIGVTDHLADHSLQQFIDSLVDRPIRFRYEAYAVDGRQVGIIKVEQQRRPFRVKRRFGKLQKGAVYVRRGSSTDPTAPATPDEIASMEAAPPYVPEQAELTVAFAEPERDVLLGPALTLDVVHWALPADGEIPDFGGGSGSNDWFPSPNLGLYQDNQHYYRAFAEYVALNGFVKPARLVVSNVGPIAATDVRLELRLDADAGLLLLDSGDAPRRPARQSSIYDAVVPAGLRPLRREPGDVEIEKRKHHTTLTMECGNLQPGRQVWSETFFVGIAAQEPKAFSGHVLAGNLSAPQAFSLTLGAVVSQRELSVAELLALADDADDED